MPIVTSRSGRTLKFKGGAAPVFPSSNLFASALGPVREGLGINVRISQSFSLEERSAAGTFLQPAAVSSGARPTPVGYLRWAGENLLWPGAEPG